MTASTMAGVGNFGAPYAGRRAEARPGESPLPGLNTAAPGGLRIAGRTISWPVAITGAALAGGALAGAAWLALAHATGRSTPSWAKLPLMLGAIVGVGLLAAGCGTSSTPAPARPPSNDEPADNDPTATHDPKLPNAPQGAAPSSLPDGDDPEFGIQKIASGLESPVYTTGAPGDDRLYSVELTGRISTIANGKQATFLDLREIVATESGTEKGMSSIAFHPDYARNGRFFVFYVDRQNNSRVVEYHAENGVADPNSARDLMSIPHPYVWHYSGQLQFGADGQLYIALGDGGDVGDPQNLAQNPNDLHGKILRIDVDRGAPYTIPADNMFPNGEGGLPEIWAMGIRNAWRWSFDRQTGDLYLGDVGQNTWEEVHVLPSGTPAGANLGWDAFEGTHPYDPKATPGTLFDPVHEYSHDEGCAIMGGFVYRGSKIPGLRGWYLFADFCSSDHITALKVEQGKVVGKRTIPVGLTSISGFGQDNDGELYVNTLGGDVHKIVPKGSAPATPNAPGPTPPPAATQIVVVPVAQRGFAFAQTEIHVPAGPVTLRLDNPQNGYHDIAVRVDGRLIGPSTKELTITFERGKRYEFVCTPHEGMGMRGTIIVD